MTFHCIGDEDTVRGFRLAGVTGDAVEDPSSARTALGRALRQPDLGIVIVTERVATWLRHDLDAARRDRDQPLLVEIPGPEGPQPQRQDAARWVAFALGIRSTQILP